MAFLKPIVRRNSTYAKVSFFNHTPVLGLNRTDAYDPYALRGLGESSLVSFVYEKSLGRAAGTVTIVLKPTKTSGLLSGQPWTTLVSEGDWWGIDIVKNGVEQGLSFGRVDSVMANFAASATGDASGTVTITGRTVGWALDDTPVYFNPHDPAIDNALGINMISVIDQIVGKPGLVVTNMIKGLMGAGGVVPLLGGQVEVPLGLGLHSPPTQRWSDMVDFTKSVSLAMRGTVFAANAISPQGAPSIWNLVESWRNPAMNELFIDEVPMPGYPKRAHLVMREKPFVNATNAIASPWYSLTNWNVECSMVRSAQLTKGANRVNHIQLTGDMLPGLGNDAYGLYQPVADRASIKRHGLRRLEENTRYFDDLGEAGFEGPLGANDWLGLIVSWNALNHEYWQGALDLAEMRAEIRVGQKITLVNGPLGGYDGFPSGGVALPPGNPSDPLAMTFYVEGTKLTYVEGENPTCSTSLTVSRGYVEGLRLPALAAAVLQFSTTEGLPIAPTTGGSVPPPQPNIVNPIEALLIDATGFGGAFDPGDHSAVS